MLLWAGITDVNFEALQINPYLFLPNARFFCKSRMQSW